MLQQMAFLLCNAKFATSHDVLLQSDSVYSYVTTYVVLINNETLRWSSWKSCLRPKGGKSTSVQNTVFCTFLGPPPPPPPIQTVFHKRGHHGMTVGPTRGSLTLPKFVTLRRFLESVQGSVQRKIASNQKHAMR